MKTVHRIAILDTLVDSNVVDVEKIVLLNDKETFQNGLSNISKTENISHGTICAKIIKKFDLNAAIICIQVLKDDDSGSISELERALDWCFHESIDIVNLSLGTVNPFNRPRLLSLVNYYANRGMTIIAATSNKGLLTYPASFSNVIGVVSDEVMEHKQLDIISLGIDIQAKAEHVILVRDNSITTPKSNSFATPYVSTIVAKIVEKVDDKSISAIKNELYNQEYYTYPMASCNEPDWISSAYLANLSSDSLDMYYFNVTDLKEADTIIVDSKEMLEKYKVYKKHMVYLGNEVVVSPNPMRFFWSKQNKIRQIVNTKIIENRIDIPILILEQSYKLNDIETLNALKKRFKNDGYNLCAISTRIDSVLYDIEYIPEELLEQKSQIYSFIYWKTYFQKSNIVVLASNDAKKLMDIFIDMDVLIKVKTIKGSVQVFIIFKDHTHKIIYKDYCSKELSIDIYEKIRVYFKQLSLLNKPVTCGNESCTLGKKNVH